MNETIELKLPPDSGISDFEIKMIVAAKLYESGRLSTGQAAEIVGLSKRAFLELLHDFGVSVFGYDETELTEDLKNL
jgi:predicted HTH domain antitoxin